MKIPNSDPHSTDKDSRRRLSRVAGLVIFSVVVLVIVALAQIAETGNSLKKEESLQIIHGAAVTFMGSDTLNKGYNFLRGAGADPKYARSVGQFTLQMAKTLEYGGTVYYQPDQVDLTMNAGCQSNSDTRSAETSSSSAAVRSYAQSKSESFSAQAEVSVGSKKSFWSFLTGGSSARVGGGFSLAFGSSSASRDGRAYARQGYMSSSSSWVRSSLFNVYVDWRSEHKLPNGSRLDFAYEPSFLEDAAAINAATAGPDTEKLVMELFERWGTHVIGEATYGSQCSSTLYIQGEATSMETQRMAQEAGSRRLEWNAYAEVSTPVVSASAQTSGSQSSNFAKQTSTHGTYKNKLEYQVGNVHCEGYIKDNLCDAKFAGAEDNPVMVEYTPIEIWNVRKGTGAAVEDVFNDRGKSFIEDAVRKIGDRMEDCRNQRCGRKGFCVMSSGFWDSVREGDYIANDFSTNLNAFEKDCLCDNGAVSSEIGCTYGREQLEKMESMSNQVLGHIFFNLVTKTGHSWEITSNKFYEGTGARVGTEGITFANGAQSCSNPRIALGWTLMYTRARDGYHMDASVMPGSVSSTGFGLELKATHNEQHLQVGIDYLVVCDPRITIGFVTTSWGFADVKPQWVCPDDKKRAWAGISKIDTLYNWFRVIVRLHGDNLIYAEHNGESDQTKWSYQLPYRVDYALWCEDDIPREQMQTGVAVGYPGGVNAKDVTIYFKPRMACNQPQIITAIAEAAAVNAQSLAGVKIVVISKSQYGMTMRFEPFWGNLYHGVYARWLAYC